MAKNTSSKDNMPTPTSKNNKTISIIAGVLAVIVVLGILAFIGSSFITTTTVKNAAASTINRGANGAATIFTISDAPTNAPISALNLKLKSLSIHSKTNGLWYQVPTGNKATYNLVALKNIYSTIGQAEVPAGAYDEMRINISSINATINGTSDPVLMPNDSIDIPINFTIFNTIGNSSDWFNLDVNLADSLHQIAGGRDIGDLLFLPDVQVGLRENATLGTDNSDNIASITVWGITPIYQSFGMEIDGGMFRNLIVPNDTAINVSDSGAIEVMKTTTSTYPGEYGVKIENVSSEELSCDQGYILGNDKYCHPECTGTGGYCIEDSLCSDNQCMPNSSCPEGDYPAIDGRCYPINDTSPCPPGYYDGGNGNCYVNPDYLPASCESGYVMLQDGHCRLPAPNSTTTIENGGTTCGVHGCPLCPNGQYAAFNNVNICYTTCPSGTYGNADGICMPFNATTTTILSNQNGNLLPETAPPTYSCGYDRFLGKGQKCYPTISNDIVSGCDNETLGTNGNTGQEDPICNPYGFTCPAGFYRNGDGLCYYNTLAVDTVDPYVTCNGGYYLGPDNYCHIIENTSSTTVYYNTSTTTAEPGFCTQPGYWVPESEPDVCCPPNTYYENGCQPVAEPTTTVTTSVGCESSEVARSYDGSQYCCPSDYPTLVHGTNSYGEGWLSCCNTADCSDGGYVPFNLSSYNPNWGG
jgi:hypothetical protein